jgi:hypothetical protein
MSFASQPKKAVALVLLFQVFFPLFFGTAVVQADGEEPFVGVIDRILSDRITVAVTQARYSERTVGEKITVLIREDPRIIDKSRNLIGFERLSVGSVVRIKPITRPNKDVEADIIQIVGGG